MPRRRVRCGQQPVEHVLHELIHPGELKFAETYPSSSPCFWRSFGAMLTFRLIALCWHPFQCNVCRFSFPIDSISSSTHDALTSTEKRVTISSHPYLRFLHVPFEYTDPLEQSAYVRRLLRGSFACLKNALQWFLLEW